MKKEGKGEKERGRGEKGRELVRVSECVCVR